MLYSIITSGLVIYSYLIVDPVTHNSAVIDPVRQVEPLIEKIEETHAHVIAILETHVHADFVSGAQELKSRLPDNPLIYCSALGGKEWIPAYADIQVQDRLEIDLGSLLLQAWHTPGHTPEHLSWIIYDKSKDSTIPIIALTGDFLFVQSVGRPDLLGEKNTQELAKALYHSVFSILPQFPDTMQIYPSHGAGSLCGKSIGSAEFSTLGQEKKHNPFLQNKSEKEWVEELLKNAPPIPEHFKKIKALNITGVPLLKEIDPFFEISSIDLSHYTNDQATVIDLRDQEQFAKLHISHSINIPFNPLWVNWAPLVVTDRQPIVLIASDKKTAEAAYTFLRLLGINSSCSYFIWNEESAYQLLNLRSFPFTPAQELFEQLQTTDSIQVVDVRTLPEWQEGHIVNAIHIPLQQLAKRLDELPRNKPLAIICRSGYRASIAASLLEKEGFLEVSNIQGGMQAWNQAELPVNRP